jgi:hypothetical protein
MVLKKIKNNYIVMVYLQRCLKSGLLEPDLEGVHNQQEKHSHQ